MRIQSENKQTTKVRENAVDQQVSIVFTFASDWLRE